MLKQFLFSGFLLFSLSTQAQIDQTDEWKKSLSTENKDTVAWVRGGVFSLGLNEGFLHNWAAGGEVTHGASLASTGGGGAAPA